MQAFSDILVFGELFFLMLTYLCISFSWAKGGSAPINSDKSQNSLANPEFCDHDWQAKQNYSVDGVANSKQPVHMYTFIKSAGSLIWLLFPRVVSVVNSN